MCNKNGMNCYPKCGEIWICNITKREGSIQSGLRPVFILSNNKNNTYAPTLNVIPLTTKINKRNLPVHVTLYDYEQYGLKQPSTMLVEQTTTISSDNLEKYVGIIEDTEVLKNICKALSVQFPILRMVTCEV